jgi:outer membrane receptor for ferrienterochelin and colicin
LYATDFGIEQRFGEEVTLRVTGFYNLGRDQISLKLQSDNKEHYVNHDRIRTAGIEVETGIDINRNLQVMPSYTYTFSEDDTTRKRLDYVPEHVGGLTLLGRLPAGKAWLQAAFDLQAVGPRQYVSSKDAKVREELEAHALANLRLQCAWPWVALFADFFNLWNADYLENESIRAPGFQFLAGVRVETRKPWK